MWPHGLQHARLPCPSLSPKGCSNSRPLSWWCHLTISSSVTSFSSCPQSYPFPITKVIITKIFEILGELPEWRDMKWANAAGRMMPTDLLYKVATRLQFVQKIIIITIICKMQWSESEVAQSCPILCDPMYPMESIRLLNPWDFVQ